MTNIYNISGQTGTDSVEINNENQIVFETTTQQSTTAPTSSSLYFWQNGTTTSIGSAAGIASYALNDSGVVAANWPSYAYYLAPKTDTAITWQNGVTTNLGTFQGFYPEPVGIDDNGAIYGNSTSISSGALSGRPQDFLFQNGVLSQLPADVTPPNFTEAVPFTVMAVNRNGDVLGWISTTLNTGPTASATNPWVSYSYILRNGTATPLNIAVAQGQFIFPTAINNSDQVVGEEQGQSTTYGFGTAFFWQNGVKTYLPALQSGDTVNSALAINDSGLVVGFSGASLASERAVVWKNGAVTDLNSLLPANSGWELYRATGINDSGQIVGVGSFNGSQQAFELTLPNLTVSAATAVSQLTAGTVFTPVDVSDSAANILTNLGALQSLASSNLLDSIALTDAAPPTISLPAATLVSDKAALAKISGTFTLQVADTASAVSANLDTLSTLVKSGGLSSIVLTDTGIPTMTINASQLTTDAGALKAISGTYSLIETAPSASATIAGSSGALGNTLVLSGNADQYTITPSGDGQHFTVSGNGITDQLSDIQALQFADHTLIVAQTPGAANLPTTGNITELYGAAFGRQPDVAGLSYYQQQLAANPTLSLTTLAQEFLASPEYQNNTAHAYAQTADGDARFVTDLYNNLLHRAPEAGATAWYEANVIAPVVQGLTPGTQAYTAALAQAHATVVTDFSQSGEFLGNVQVTAQNQASAQHWLVLI